jgi:biopolymer transport protein TolR
LETRGINPQRWIAADKGVRYQEVMDVMTLLQKAQITRIGLLARPAS